MIYCFRNAFSGSLQTSKNLDKRTRDGTAEPVSRDRILRRERGQGKVLIFPLQMTTSRIGQLTRLIHTLLCVMTIHTFKHALYRVQYHPCSKQLVGVKSEKDVVRFSLLDGVSPSCDHGLDC